MALIPLSGGLRLYDGVEGNIIADKELVKMKIPVPKADINARDAIPPENRTIGMECKVGKKTYKLIGGTENDNWKEIASEENNEWDGKYYMYGQSTYDAWMPELQEVVTVFRLQKTTKSRVAIHKAEKGGVYTITKGTSDSFRVGVCEGNPIDGRYQRLIINDKNATSCRVELQDDEDTIIIGVSAANNEPELSIIKEGAVKIDLSNDAISVKKLNQSELHDTIKYKGNFVSHIAPSTYEQKTEYIPAVKPSTGNLETIYGLWDALVTAHPAYMSSTVLEEDDAGLEIKQYTISPVAHNFASNADGFAPLKVLYFAGLHGDEFNLVYDDYIFFKDLVENAALTEFDPTLRMIFDNFKFIITPICTPWAYNNYSRTNSNGVNINLNFPANWKLTEEGQQYSGTHAGSEKETQAIMKCINDHPDAFFIVDHHGTDNFTNGQKIGYTATDWLLVRKIMFAVNQRFDTYVKNKYEWITGDNEVNLTRGVMTTRNFSNIAGLSQYVYKLGRKGMLLELCGTLGNDYPNGTLEDYQKIATAYMGLLWQTIALFNNEFFK